MARNKSKRITSGEWPFETVQTITPWDEYNTSPRLLIRGTKQFTNFSELSPVPVVYVVATGGAEYGTKQEQTNSDRKSKRKRAALYWD